MREQPTPQEQLTDIVTEAIRLRREKQFDFSSKGIRIDQVVPEDVLEKYNPVVVVQVAAEMGFDYEICVYNQVHGPMRARANGKWVDLPAHVSREIQTKYIHQSDGIVCPDCVAPYKSRMKATAEILHSHPEATGPAAALLLAQYGS